MATVDLVAIHADGLRTHVALRVGAPERAPTGEWQCAVHLDGLQAPLIPVHGEDSLQALCLALSVAATALRAFVARGGRLLYAEESGDTVDEVSWPLDAYFGWLGTPRSPAS